MVSLPRVPDGRAGSGHCWAGLMALVNKCKQCGNIIISVPEMPAHCFALLRSSGGIFGREKYIFGFSEFNYTYWALVRAPGRVRWHGLQRMGLDYDFPIRKLLPFRDVRFAWGSGLLLGTVFHGNCNKYVYFQRRDWCPSSGLCLNT